MTKVGKMRALGISLLLVAAGCGDDEGARDAAVDLSGNDLTVPDFAEPPLCDDNQVGDAGLPATMASVQQVFDRSCIGCHCCGDPVDLTAGRAHDSLVNRTVTPENGTDESCGGPMVTPGDTTHSYLYQKLQPQPCSGLQMPVSEFTSVTLPMCQLDLVRRWIESGAPSD
jgi:hypothetical protein